MRELDAPCDREQPCVHRRVHRRRVDLEVPRSGVKQDRVAERLGRRDEDEELCVGWEPMEAPHEALFDLAGDRMALGETEAAGELGGVPRSRELEERERVAVALGDDLVTDGRIQRADQVLEQQGTCVAIVECADEEIREPRHDAVAEPRPRAAYDRDPLGEEAPGDEGKDPCGCLVEPLRVVDDADEWLVLG